MEIITRFCHFLRKSYQGSVNFLRKSYQGSVIFFKNHTKVLLMFFGNHTKVLLIFFKFENGLKYNSALYTWFKHWCLQMFTQFESAAWYNVSIYQMSYVLHLLVRFKQINCIVHWITFIGIFRCTGLFPFATILYVLHYTHYKHIITWKIFSFALKVQIGSTVH